MLTPVRPATRNAPLAVVPVSPALLAPPSATVPALVTRNSDALLSMKLIEPPDAMLLMGSSCVELLNPWNWPSAPFWS